MHPEGIDLSFSQTGEQDDPSSEDTIFTISKRGSEQA